MKIIKTIDGMELREFGQVGYRGEDGKVSKRLKLYAEIEPELVDPDTGLTEYEKESFDDIGALFAEKYSQYIRECRKKGIKL